jgi:hypothetical protein
MTSTNIWKKQLNNRRILKKGDKILNDVHFKPKKKKIFSNLFKKNLITNWIENEEESEFSIDSNLNEEDKDSLQLENLEYLSTMKNIIFLDLENFSSFFQHLTNDLPDQTYIIAFQGSNIQWKPPKKFKNLLFTQIFSLVFVLEI